jgi:hypothetical protein
MMRFVAGVVESIDGTSATIRVDSGEVRRVDYPDEILVEVGMTVYIHEFEDGSGPIVLWGT